MTTSRTLGLLHIGQSHSTGSAERLFQKAFKGWQILSYGAFDQFSDQEIEELEKQPATHPVRADIRTGREIVLSHEVFEHHIQQAIQEQAAKGLTISVVLCTLDFPGLVLPANHLVIQPQEIITGLMSCMRFRGKLGVVVPLEDQVAAAQDRWSQTTGHETQCVAIELPVKKARVEQSTAVLVDAGCQVIMLDCMSYKSDLKSLVQKQAKVPTLLAMEAVVKGTQAILS
jgi:protein AroM